MNLKHGYIIDIFLPFTAISVLGKKEIIQFWASFEPR